MKEVYILYLTIFNEDNNTYSDIVYGVYSTKELAESFMAVAKAENSNDSSVVDYIINCWSVI